MAENDIALRCKPRPLEVADGVTIESTYSPVINREAVLFNPSDDSLYKTAWERPEVQPNQPGLKWCPDCGDWRPHSYFDTDKSRGDGLRGYCREHQRRRNRIYDARRAEGLRRRNRKNAGGIRTRGEIEGAGE